MCKRNSIADELDKDMPAAHLLKMIAKRAKRTNEYNENNLKINEAFLGDYWMYGMTEQQYRTAKQKLEKNGFTSFKSTNKGTIATLLNTSIYDINTDDANEQLTNKQRTTNEQATTNNNGNNSNNDKNVNKTISKESKKFIQPTVEEVTEYCNTNKYTISPNAFVDFYTSKGWLVGKSPMKDWKAAVRTWVNKRKENDPPEPTINYAAIEIKKIEDARKQREIEKGFSNATANP